MNIKELHQKVKEVYAHLDRNVANFRNDKDPLRPNLSDKELCQEWWLEYSLELVRDLNHALAMASEGDRELTEDELKQYKHLEHLIPQRPMYPSFSDTKEQANEYS